MAETMTPAQVRDLARKSGRELAAVGINLNLAPVLDLATDPEARFMYERCFSHDPETALAYGLAVIEGHRDHGILTAAKHFPGIGATRRDPHLELPTVDLSEDRIRRVDMVPFAGAVSARVDAVMTSHIVYPALDPTQAATFSPKIVTSLLREELGFEGLILTDDMEMGAVTGQGNIGPAAVRSVQAGADLVLVCRRAELVREVRACLYQAAETDALSLADMQKSHDRLALALVRVAAHPKEALKEVFQVA
jgi:beta-N-acetylhexosaminidase